MSDPFVNDDFFSVDVRDEPKENLKNNQNLNETRPKVEIKGGRQENEPQNVENTVGNDSTLQHIGKILKKYNPTKKSNCSYLTLLLETCKNEVKQIKIQKKAVTTQEINKMIGLIGEVSSEIKNLTQKVKSEHKMNRRMVWYCTIAVSGLIGTGFVLFLKK